MKKYLFIRVDYQYGFIATLRTEYGEQLEVIKTRSLKYLRLIARNNKAQIIPGKYA